MSQINSRQITCAFWLNHWKNHNYATEEESSIGPVTWHELTDKFDSVNIVDGHINNWIEVRKHSNNERITEFPPHLDPRNDEKYLYRIHFKGADIAMETRYEIILDLNEEELAAIQKKYPTKDTFHSSNHPGKGCTTLADKKLEQFKIWFEHWSGVDYADDLFDERPLNELVEEYGMDSLQYVAAQEWMNFYSGGGLIQDITVFDTEVDEEDKDTCIEMHFDADNMAQASHMLKDDPAYREQLEEVNDLYGYPFDDGDSGEDTDEDSEEEVECRTPPKRKRDEDECPPAPKKAKCDSSKYRPQPPMQAFLEEQNESGFFTENKMQEGDEIVATAVEGDILENEDGTKTLEVIELSTFKFWFKHWAEIDFADDTVDELSWEEMVEEYGEDNIKLAVNKEWISLYFGGGEVTDLPPEFDQEDEHVCIEMVVNGENMARASAMLKGDDTYKEDLVSVNDLYGSPYDDCDSDSEEEVCPPAPKKAKRQFPKVYQTPEGPVMEDKNGTLTFPDGTVSEVVSIYSDSSMPGGVIDDNGCIKQDAPNLVTKC
jgi:hypothetical protein